MFSFVCDLSRYSIKKMRLSSIADLLAQLSVSEETKRAVSVFIHDLGDLSQTHKIEKFAFLLESSDVMMLGLLQDNFLEKVRVERIPKEPLTGSVYQTIQQGHHYAVVVRNLAMPLYFRMEDATHLKY